LSSEAPSPRGLDARYGRRAGSAKRARWWIVGIAAFAVLLAVLWYFFAGPGLASSATSGPSGDVSSSNVVDANHMQITFTVDGLTGKPAACAVGAQSEDFAMVGWKIITIPASTEKTKTYTMTLRTTRVATAGLVDQCWLT
jgi:hypothetical protein